jgi:hypothetical protein
MRLLLIILVLLSGCASQDPWTRDDTVWQGIAFATMAMDAHMTTKIQDHPNIIENGPIAKHALGQTPSTGGTWMYMGTVMLSHYLIARALPHGWRTMWQVGGIYRHGMAIQNGRNLGLFNEPCTVNPCELR